MSGAVDDRAAGVLLGAACGDALGAGYEFGPPLDDDVEVAMQGGGAFDWAPGEWTDDTSMAVPILQAVAAGEPLTNDATLDAIVAAWTGWSTDAKDVGAQTRQVLGSLRQPTAAAAERASADLHRATGRTAGNGSLMRTAPVALAFVDDPGERMLASTARRISGLTHHDRAAGDACVLWCAAIRHAVRTGQLDLRRGVALLPEPRRAEWTARIDEAEAKRPRDFPQNGWVVQALQAAWSAIATTPVPERQPGRHLRRSLEAAVCGGNDTDTVAAIAGALLGARWGASAVPAAWRRILHGWPGLTARDLTRMAVLAVNTGHGDGTGWPAADRVPPFGARTLVTHPHDAGVRLGSLRALDDLPPDIDSVVSLCRTGRTQTDRTQVEFWLVDQDGRNPNLDLVLTDAADTVKALRDEGRTVLIHCAEGRSRTAAVGALYSARHRGRTADAALREVTAALPQGAPAPFLQRAVRRIAPAKPVLYVDLDGTMVDFASGVERLPAHARATYEGRYDDAPGIFALMEPMPGAIEAFRTLATVYDAYLLSTAPWDNPSAWQQKLEWVQTHFGRAEWSGGQRNPAYKRLILSHHKTLSAGAFLVDDRPPNGPGAFAGEWLCFGEPPYQDWPAVTAYLLGRAEESG